jgi:ATP-dependent DNA helicase Rep
LSGGQSFFEKAEIKDITSYLRLLANHDDDPAFIRAVNTPRRGVGSSTLQALGSYAGERRISLFAAASNKALCNAFRHASCRPCSSSANSSIACRHAPSENRQGR